LSALFADFPNSGRDLPSLARAVLDLAAHSGGLNLPGPGGGDDLAGLDPRLWRPFLAALAKAAADETGAAFDPYHGLYTVTRSVAGEGLVRLDVRIENTPGVQRCDIRRADSADRRRDPSYTDPTTDHLAPMA
jgi:hypothetical protein